LLPLELAFVPFLLPEACELVGVLLLCGFVSWAAEVIANASTTAMHKSNFFIVLSFLKSIDIALNEVARCF
jgi:hypothetical protein